MLARAIWNFQKFIISCFRRSHDIFREAEKETYYNHNHSKLWEVGLIGYGVAFGIKRPPAYTKLEELPDLGTQPPKFPMTLGSERATE